MTSATIDDYYEGFCGTYMIYPEWASTDSALTQVACISITPGWNKTSTINVYETEPAAVGKSTFTI